MHYYTSITANYLPKARVLARSVKRHDVQATFHLLLADREPEGFDLAAEPFDSVIHLEDLDIDNVEAWAFQHSLVELCTAVKGPGAQFIVQRHRPDKLAYFDPDMVVFGGLETLAGELDSASVLLTPHLTAPESDVQGILDNEISALKHGTYNLGFIAFRCDRSDGGKGLEALNWWAARLLHFCRDDIPGGLFTDQRWADLMPGLFDGVRILREPVYNVATWNLSHRRATGTAPDTVLINGKPLGFYHFSGFDSGAQEAMLGRYGHHSPVLLDLRRWYIDACEREGQSTLGKRPYAGAAYDDGTLITRAERVLYRERGDLQKAFPHPLATADVNRSYRHWYAANVASPQGAEAASAPSAGELQRELQRTREELAALRRSRSWQIGHGLVRWAARLTGRPH